MNTLYVCIIRRANNLSFMRKYLIFNVEKGNGSRLKCDTCKF